MKKRTKKLVSLLLVIVFMFTCALGTSAKEIKFPYTDVAKTHWAAQFIQCCYDRKVMLGTSPTKFSPNSNLKREDAVVIIGRMYEDYKMTTIDVKLYPQAFNDNKDKNTYYYKYINWAKSNKFVSGQSTTTFGVGKQITRKELAMMIVGFQKQMSIKKDVYRHIYPPTFTDVSNLTGPEKDAIRDCAEGKIFSGYSDRTFRPNNKVTRAEMATIIFNMYDNQLWALFRTSDYKKQ